MKTFILFFLISFEAFAFDYNSIDLGATVTWHNFGGTYTKQLKNKINESGLVQNTPHISLSTSSMDESSYTRASVFYTKDCLAQHSYGAYYSTGLVNGNWKVGFLMGFYIIQTPAWKNVDVPIYWSDVSKNRGLVPLIGLDLTYSFYQGKKFHIESKTVITLPIIHSGLFVGVDF